MKITSALYLILILLVMSGSHCRKNKSRNPIDKLPPETSSGAKTFGCLIDGQAFIPAGSSLSGPNLSSAYQYMITGTPAGFTFSIHATDKKNTSNIISVVIGFDSVAMQAGTYPLALRSNGKGGAQVTFYNNEVPNGDFYKTTTAVKGELNLKKFDPFNQIASGTFWFDAVNPANRKIEVREGRFDVRYHQ